MTSGISLKLVEGAGAAERYVLDYHFCRGIGNRLRLIQLVERGFENRRALLQTLVYA